MKYLADTVTLHLNHERCIGCGMCTNVCPHGVFMMQDGKAKIVERDNCMECGACKKNCPVTAIEVKAGVGCAAAVINGLRKGGAPDCDCSGSSSKCCG